MNYTAIISFLGGGVLMCESRSEGRSNERMKE